MQSVPQVFNDKMQLTQKDTIKLIEEFRNRRCLWDPTCADFNNRAMKRNNYAELATLFDVGYKDVESKLHNLRSQFYREHKKVETSKLTGRDDTFVPRWYGYDLLLFLIGVEKPDSNLAKIKVLAEESTGNDEDIPSNLSHCEEVLENGEVHTEDTQVYRRPRKRKVWGTSTLTFDTIVNLNRPNDHTPTQYENQFTAFARYVEAELREIKNGRRLLILKKKIQDLIFETKLEEMDNNC